MLHLNFDRRDKIKKEELKYSVKVSRDHQKTTKDKSDSKSNSKPEPTKRDAKPKG